MGDDHRIINHFPTVIQPSPRRISLHRRGASSRRCLAWPRSAQSHGNAAWRGVRRWRTSRATMCAARRHRKKKWMLESFWRFFLLGFYKISPSFFVDHWLGEGWYVPHFCFLGIESTYIRALSNHWPKLDKKNKVEKTGAPRMCLGRFSLQYVVNYWVGRWPIPGCESAAQDF